MKKTIIDLTFFYPFLTHSDFSEISSIKCEALFSETKLESINIYDINTHSCDPYLQNKNELNHFIFSKLEINGTIFQKKVWKEICKIPLGTTISYKELAIKIGHPKAYRAVASACSQNKLALIIPCHRVIGSNGDLCDYRWGENIKEKLIAFEKSYQKIIGNL